MPNVRGAGGAGAAWIVGGNGVFRALLVALSAGADAKLVARGQVRAGPASHTGAQRQQRLRLPAEALAELEW